MVSSRLGLVSVVVLGAVGSGRGIDKRSCRVCCELADSFEVREEIKLFSVSQCKAGCAKLDGVNGPSYRCGKQFTRSASTCYDLFLHPLHCDLDITTNHISLVYDASIIQDQSDFYGTDSITDNNNTPQPTLSFTFFPTPYATQYPSTSPTHTLTHSPTTTPTTHSPTTTTPTTHSPTTKTPTTHSPTTKTPTTHSPTTKTPTTHSPTTKTPTTHSPTTKTPTTHSPTTKTPTTHSPTTKTPTTHSPTTKTPTTHSPTTKTPTTLSPTTKTPTSLSPTTRHPSHSPVTKTPTNHPTSGPSKTPSNSPSTQKPTTQPPTNSPTKAPTHSDVVPINTRSPTALSTHSPTNDETTPSGPLSQSRNQPNEFIAKLKENLIMVITGGTIIIFSLLLCCLLVCVCNKRRRNARHRRAVSSQQGTESARSQGQESERDSQHEYAIAPFSEGPGLHSSIRIAPPASRQQQFDSNAGSDLSQNDVAYQRYIAPPPMHHSSQQQHILPYVDNFDFDEDEENYKQTWPQQRVFRPPPGL